MKESYLNIIIKYYYKYHFSFSIVMSPSQPLQIVTQGPSLKKTNSDSRTSNYIITPCFALV